MSLKWGIIGPGKIARRLVEDLKLVEGCELYAVGSRTLSNAEAFATDYQAKKSYGSYEALCNDPDIDVIYIATPHHSHAELSILAMNHGKHVLCEKPIAVNHPQVESMVAAATHNRVFLMEALWTRFNPCIKAVKSEIDQGAIGEIKSIEANFCFNKVAPAMSRMFNMELAGGALLDVGIYPIFLAYLILGKPQAIKAVAQKHETGADIQCSAILQYESALAHMVAGFNSSSDMRAKIDGSKGNIIIQPRWHAADTFDQILQGETSHYSYPKTGHGMYHEIVEVRDCIEKGLLESPNWSHKNSLDLISILDEIRSQIDLKYPFE